MRTVREEVEALRTKQKRLRELLARVDASAARSALVAAVVRFATRDIVHAHSLAALARAAGTGRSHLSRAFHRQSGVLLWDWLRALRVRHAHRILDTAPADIREVARAAGFPCVRTLERTFRFILGTSPRRYRTLAPRLPR
jgi:transcriptional regulator GlxA family with amidase domain